jgi:hypothetical protein
MRVIPVPSDRHWIASTAIGFWIVNLILDFKWSLKFWATAYKNISNLPLLGRRVLCGQIAIFSAKPAYKKCRNVNNSSLHCKDKMAKIWNKYSQKRNIGASVPISTFMCLWANYIFPRWVCLFCWRKYVDRSWEYLNRSKTHECGNWGWGRAIPRKGIFKRNCRCSVENSSWVEYFKNRYIPFATFPTLLVCHWSLL